MVRSCRKQTSVHLPKMTWVVPNGHERPSPKVCKQGLEGQLASRQGYCEETAEACPIPEPP